MKPVSLSHQQIEKFERDGFIVVKNFYSSDEMQQIAAWTDEVNEFPETPGEHMMYFEHSLTDPKSRIINRIENYCPYHENFNTLINHSSLINCVGQLFSEPAVLFKEKINFKLPGGDGFTPHQDVQAGWDTYAKLHITALVSIDHATSENGYLEIAAGHHQRGLLGKSWRPLQDEELTGVIFEPCETEPGDAVFFDSFVPHRSGPNLSDQARRILYVTYNKQSEGDHCTQYYVDKRKSYPPDCEREDGKNYSYRV